MSILDFLRKIKLPTFDDDFIEDPADKASADAPRIRGKVVSDPRGEARVDNEEPAVRSRLSKLVQLGDSSDPNFFPTPGFDDED